jgi:hypothetical protein
MNCLKLPEVEMVSRAILFINFRVTIIFSLARGGHSVIQLTAFDETIVSDFAGRYEPVMGRNGAYL